MLTIQVSKFLDKNYDQVRQDVLDLFIQSKNKVRAGGALARVVLITIILIYLNSICKKKEKNFVFVCVQMVSNLFLVHTEVTGQQRGGHMRKSSTVTRKYQAPTVSNKFQQSLLELVEKMER